MNVLGARLEEREARDHAEQEAEECYLRETAGVDRVERVQAWDSWLRTVLERSLVWPPDGAAKARLLHQCANEITRLSRQLRGRGWLLDGKALAVHVRAMLEPIGKAQRAGAVRDFWPYFRASVSKYVGAHAEEIQAHARTTGADVGAQSFAAVVGALGLGSNRKRASDLPSLTELLAQRADEVGAAKAESLREAAARRRREEKSQDRNLPLFNGL